MNAETPLARETELPVAPNKQKGKPRVALMGEFSAGKSTLANVLLGTSPLPVQITATRLPPVWISEGAETTLVIDPDGQEMEIDRAALASIPLQDAQLIRLSQQAPILELCDLIDMPGISDPNMPPAVWQSLIAEVDHVIWCTHATQAWRQSEAAVWQNLLDQISGDSLLVVTQIDKVRSERDRNRILARLARETRGLFREVCPISLLEAENAGEDKDGWQDSGASVVVERLVEILLAPAHRQVEASVVRRKSAPNPSAPPTEQPVIPRRVVRSDRTIRRVERPSSTIKAQQEHGS